MSDTKFTPGPWFANRRYIGVPRHKSFIGEARDGNGNWSDTERSIANAHLIAAAPELYEALTRCKFDSLNMTFADLEFCKAAMAKARGEKS